MEIHKAYVKIHFWSCSVCFSSEKQEKKGVQGEKPFLLPGLWLLVKKCFFFPQKFQLAKLRALHSLMKLCDHIVTRRDCISLWARDEFRWYFLICLACRCGTPLHHSPMQWTVLFSNIIYLSQRTANPFLASSSQTSEVTTTEWARSQELWRKPAGLWDQLQRALGLLLEPLTLTFEGWLRVISHKLALQYIISPLLPWGHGFKDSGGRTWTGL